MKLNPQLLARLSSNNINTDNFVKRLEEQKNKKLEPEQFANSSSNFRVRTLGEQKEKQEDLKQSQSYYKEEANQLGISQMTQSTTIQNSQMTMASPNINGTNTHRMLNHKPMISVKMQQSLVFKRPSQPVISNKSNVIDTEQITIPQVQTIPKTPIMKKLLLIPKAPQNKQQIQMQMQIQMQQSQLNNSQLTDRPAAQSLNNSIISENVKNTIMAPAQTKILMGKMRGLSQVGNQSKLLTQPNTTQLRKINSSVNNSIDQDIPHSQSSSSFMLKKRVNSQILDKEIEEKLVYEFIDENIIKDITSKQQFEFDDVTKVCLRFNSKSDSLQQLGEILPSLTELRLDVSFINSLRDLGTRMQNLRILWISRSQVKDISGIMGLQNLKELYCCFNNISDLSPLAFHDNLEVLDVEANDISDESQIDFLESLEKLESLNLAQNPILKNFSTKVSERLFSVLNEYDDSDAISDDLSQDKEYTNNVDKLYELAQYIFDVDELRSLNTKLKEELKVDWMAEPNELNLIAEQIKAIKPQNAKLQRPQTAMNPRTNINDNNATINATIKLFDFQNEMNPDPTSSLTQMQDQVLCGNPLKAARYNKTNKQISGAFDPSDRKSMDIRNIMKQFQK